MADEHSALIDSEDLAGEPVTHRDAGATMAWLARRDLLEFDIQRWTGANTTPAVWSVERTPVTDGGECTGTTEDASTETTDTTLLTRRRALTGAAAVGLSGIGLTQLAGNGSAGAVTTGVFDIGETSIEHGQGEIESLTVSGVSVFAEFEGFNSYVDEVRFELSASHERTTGSQTVATETLGQAGEEYAGEVATTLSTFDLVDVFGPGPFDAVQSAPNDQPLTTTTDLSFSLTAEVTDTAGNTVTDTASATALSKVTNLPTEVTAGFEDGSIDSEAPSGVPDYLQNLGTGTGGVFVERADGERVAMSQGQAFSDVFDDLSSIQSGDAFIAWAVDDVSETAESVDGASTTLGFSPSDELGGTGFYARAATGIGTPQPWQGDATLTALSADSDGIVTEWST
jgi:hypothetical protein